MKNYVKWAEPKLEWFNYYLIFLVDTKEKSNIGRVTTENVTKKMMDNLNIQDIELDKVDDNDDAKSTTGTYTMDEDEDLEPVSNLERVLLLYFNIWYFNSSF